jgi:hypothetical protein
MAETITLDAAGPPSPEYTVQVAHALAECVRVLTWATAGPAGIGQPAHARAVLAELHRALAGLPQLFSQLSTWLYGMAEEGALAPAGAGDVAATVATVIEALDWAEIQIGTVTSSLAQARRAAGGLSPQRDAGPPG